MEQIVEELIKGRDWTKQLQFLIQMPSNDDVAVSQQKELVDKIFVFLTETISVMRNEYSNRISEISGDRRTVESDHGSKGLAVNDRRGVSKRRRSSDSRIKVSSSIMDEYAWRKYGQKETRNSTFPRCYFRCTHKHDQGCKATKQVQRVQKEPIKYQIIYFGHHTCRKTLQPNLGNLIFDSCSEESNLINFQSYTPSDVYLSPSWPNSAKEETKKMQSDLTAQELSLSGSTTCPDLTPLTRSDIIEEFLHGVYSYASPVAYHGMDMDLFSECDEFTNCFESIY